ncbi:hypothetical protein [Aureimonas phyllosphaerae]
MVTGARNDTLYGGDGNDVAVFAKACASYAINRSQAASKIFTVSG